MSDDQQVSPQATPGESQEAKRTTPMVFVAALGAVALGVLAVMAVSAKYVFH